MNKDSANGTVSDEVTVDVAPTVVRLQGASLRVVSGPDREVARTMDTPCFTVGKGDDVDLRLSDRQISRRHVELAAKEEGLLLRDLGSRNGTWLAGCRVTEALLVADTNITIGRSTLSIRLGSEALDLEVSSGTHFGAAIGTSVPMRHAFALLERIANTTITVLLEGESGTGKEILAHAVHRASSRANGPFVVVDCASIPSNLIESELFGHERGAFTGASQSRVGAFERAHGGTIFLDELGELPLGDQAKLLRVIENREVQRVGGGKPVPIDVRVIAATNVRLAEAVRRGKFREDLYYRLSVARVVVPPLRDRKQDIVPLAELFLERLRRQSDPTGAGSLPSLPADLGEILLAHTWPGNVRELRNVVERWATFQNARPEILFGESIGRPGVQPSESGIGDLAFLPYHEAKRRALEAFDKAYFPEVLKRVGGVVAKAAELAQVPRPSFHRMLSRTRIASNPNSEDD